MRDLTVDQMEQILINTATPLTDSNIQHLQTMDMGMDLSMHIKLFLLSLVVLEHFKVK